ncbi:hypothetical protein A2778_02495 [Candidatus Daviesbacteria bacterium RIFCSPHIGHO2_01_FULL_40_24]|nr:MAG: hypothetical protein A2778_02495 [Candidatus Daviesbacteria bacterium RIFCSPHIGHO2_01_FULL_40_24]OGE28906.1 MAG: hypothetical protein A3C29_03580 [Candidatus Daviesbacteria bacterium RIFCSPHIGHO2_02_FULL_40_16]OGE42172.1 MAG: hypothetical protein A3A53_03550 [Candidatus Daviesbacteria bacterium RIFCSPLOWO2_01_FULL_39_23]OGE66290.1 MAG: hypothetical protein A3J16_00140 [Candidatus Daviesbacteria bacterium RIFCSPLOWO2_02_FULL_39_13]
MKALGKIASTARNIAADYQILEQFKDFILLDPAEFMSHKDSRGTETPDGIDNSSSEQLSVINSLPGLEGYGH